MATPTRPRESLALVFLISVLSLLVAGSAAAQMVYLDPVVSDPLDHEFTLDVMIDTAGLTVMGVQIEITFDPTIASLDYIAAGDWVTSSGLDYFFYDNTTLGTSSIHFDQAFLGQGRTGAGQVAVCHFQAAGPGDSPLEFVGVDIRDEVNSSLDFANSEGDLIHVRNGHIYIDPPESIPNDDNFTVAIAVQAPGQPIVGMSLQLTYNREVVDLDFFEPGAWITSAGLLFYFFDHTDVAPPNTIHFDMAFLEGDLAGSGQVAICHFTARHDETPGVSPLVFELVDVRDETNQTMPFTHSTGDVIIIDPAIPTEPTTWGEVKTLYHD